MHSTDGNLYALRKYEAEIDARDRAQEVIEEYLEENPEATEEEAIDYLESARQDYWDSLAEDIAFQREFW